MRRPTWDRSPRWSDYRPAATAMQALARIRNIREESARQTAEAEAELRRRLEDIERRRR